MSFNYAKLLGRMREYGYTQKKLASEIKMNESTLNQKLKNKSHFTADEMNEINRLLDISTEEIGTYFFAQ